LGGNAGFDLFFGIVEGELAAIEGGWRRRSTRRLAFR